MQVKGQSIAMKQFDLKQCELKLVQQSQPMLTSVALQTHQMNRQDRDKPIRFRITAHWEQAS